MTAKDIKPINPDAEAGDVIADGSDEGRKTVRKTNGRRGAP